MSNRPAFLHKRTWINYARKLSQRAKMMRRNYYGLAKPHWWPRSAKWRWGPAGKFDGKHVTLIAAGSQYDFAPAKLGRFRGHVYEGRLMPDEGQIRHHFAQRAIPLHLAPLFVAVARFEGGFDTIQTYDRAKFSWGLVQFALIGGLPRLLQKIKGETPALFQKYFIANGLDIEQGLLVVHKQGVRLGEWQARNQLHDDPALWKPFLLAAQEPTVQAQQLQAAYENYYLAILAKPIALPAASYSLGDFFAQDTYAYAVLFDRAVHRGLAYTTHLFQKAAHIAKIQSPQDAALLFATARSLETQHHHRWDQLLQVANEIGSTASFSKG